MRCQLAFSKCKYCIIIRIQIYIRELAIYLFFVFLSLQIRIHAVAQGSCDQLSDPQSKLRLVLQKQSIKWIELKLPNIETYSRMINGIIEAMEPLFRGRSKSAERLKRSFKTLFREAMHILLHPILLLQNLRTEASQFYKDIATELGWSSQKLQKRLFEVFTEIATTGQYVHTEQELEIGCKLAWRNSVKCIGR